MHGLNSILDELHEQHNQSRLKIPLLISEDCIHGHSFHPGATIFPTQLAPASSWNTDLLEQVARVTAIEASCTGVHWTFSPVLCLTRDLRWGRVNSACWPARPPAMRVSLARPSATAEPCSKV